jgi:hypothetical protein
MLSPEELAEYENSDDVRTILLMGHIHGLEKIQAQSQLALDRMTVRSNMWMERYDKLHKLLRQIESTITDFTEA